MAFQAFEASEAMLAAMQARCGSKAAKDAEAAGSGPSFASKPASIVVKTSAPVRSTGDFTVKVTGRTDHSNVPSAADVRTASDFTVKGPGTKHNSNLAADYRSACDVEPGMDADRLQYGNVNPSPTYVSVAGGAAPVFAVGPATRATPVAAESRTRAKPLSFDERFAAERSGPAYPFGMEAASGNSRPSSGAIGKQLPLRSDARGTGLPPTPPRLSARAAAHARGLESASFLEPQPALTAAPTALDRVAAEQVRATKAQEDLLHGQCSDLEERLRQVEQGQAAAAAAAAALDSAYAPSEADESYRYARENGPKLPSAVTVAGVPVATDGELVYLGGGLYAATSAAPSQQPQSRRPPRVMPGRARQPAPRREIGKSAVVRSASAHIVGPQTSAAARGDCSPSPSRAQSDGQLGLGGLGALEAARAGDRGVALAPKCWRPGGVQKLPINPPEPPQRSGNLTPVYGDGLGAASGNHSEARAVARTEARREARESGAGLFGQQGVLAQLREGEAAQRRERELCELRELQGRGGYAASSCSSAPMVGGPTNGDRRAAERQAAKQAKVDQLLAERAQRLAVQSATAPKMQRGFVGSASAPALALEFEAGSSSAEELEKQKLRVACKMEILDFFNGYSMASGKMSAEQTKQLLAKLHNKGSGDGHPAAPSKRCDQEREEYAEEQNERPEEQADGGHESVQRRLQQVNDLCNKAMVPADGFDEDLDL